MENKRADKRKLLRPNAVPNLLQKPTAENADQLDLPEATINSTEVENIESCRFTQDALENLFLSLRNKKAVPDAREFKQTLRLISLSQFQADVRRSNYSANDANYIIEYCKDIRNLEIKNKENQCFDRIDDGLCNEPLYLPLIENEDTLNHAMQTALYHLIDSLLYKIKSNFKHCDKCFNTFLTDCNDSNNNLSYYTKLRQYKNNLLLFPITDVFNIMYKCKLSFRRNEKNLSNALTATEFVDAFLSSLPTLSIPSCHNIMRKLIKTFLIARIHFSLQKKYMSEANNCNSHSITMKLSILPNVKCYNNKRK